jgi:hypothetical protein
MGRNGAWQPFGGSLRQRLASAWQCTRRRIQRGAARPEPWAQNGLRRRRLRQSPQGSGTAAHHLAQGHFQRSQWCSMWTRTQPTEVRPSLGRGRLRRRHLSRNRLQQASAEVKRSRMHRGSVATMLQQRSARGRFRNCLARKRRRSAHGGCCKCAHYPHTCSTL